MKKIAIIIFVLLAGSGVIMAQGEIDDRLYDKFSKKELANMSNSDISYWTYILDNGYYLTDVPKGKDTGSRVGKVSIKDLDNINLFQLGLSPIDNDYQYFLIEGTDKMLVIRSHNHIKKEFNK